MNIKYPVAMFLQVYDNLHPYPSSSKNKRQIFSIFRLATSKETKSTTDYAW